MNSESEFKALRNRGVRHIFVTVDVRVPSKWFAHIAPVPMWMPGGREIPDTFTVYCWLNMHANQVTVVDHKEVALCPKCVQHIPDEYREILPPHYQEQKHPPAQAQQTSRVIWSGVA
ncbi:MULTISPECIES: hypothetical protein [unclassified Crossiella]|uniref:hypothetical protein n=1 Tax=unclassified Crossiella TaxID=2620835 RepID=UPI001FFFEF10|nr:MULTISPECIES: hypothetical protein [unclassified Crossiella]MCK2240190.1 hypothetical protein [Crossiella sp. S99.2]MCK2253358.1 hypothetical protein [Crossiella sp. S99.1]